MESIKGPQTLVSHSYSNLVGNERAKSTIQSLATVLQCNEFACSSLLLFADSDAVFGTGFGIKGEILSAIVFGGEVESLLRTCEGAMESTVVLIGPGPTWPDDVGPDLDLQWGDF